jgi:predicted acetyltransferase
MRVDYDFAILDLADDSEAAVARRSGWIGAVLRGFRDGRPDDEVITRWVEHYRTDEVIVRGAWLPEGEFGAGPMPVATYASFDKTLNAGRELLPLRMISDVTTSATHRRRGLLRRLIEDDLTDAVDSGIPVAALTASEATIYGRWGFGPATFRQTVEVDTRPGFEMRSFVDPGRVEQIEPRDAWPHVKAVFETFHARQRGSVGWPSAYESSHTGAFDFNAGGPDSKIRGAVHLAGDGSVDGFVLYKFGENYTVKVDEMVALSPAAQLGLWAFLGGMDRITKVTFNLAHPHDPLMWSLADLNRVKVTEVEEFLWIRVLDVERALTARPWSADGQLVIAIDDPQGHAAGRFEIETLDGKARVARTDRPADVTLSAENLGSLYLGGVPVHTLRRADRVGGDDEAVARFAAMADLSEPPYCLTGF